MADLSEVQKCLNAYQATDPTIKVENYLVSLLGRSFIDGIIVSTPVGTDEEQVIPLYNNLLAVLNDVVRQVRTKYPEVRELRTTRAVSCSDTGGENRMLLEEELLVDWQPILPVSHSPAAA